MTSDFEVGRVVAIDTAEVTIELDPSVKALTRSTYEGVTEVGIVNSYVIIPVGGRRTVAMVTSISQIQEREGRTDNTMVMLPSGQRRMKGILVGTIDGDTFTQGVTTFPALDSPVLIPSEQDLEAIFCLRPGPDEDTRARSRPGYCICVGRSVVLPKYEVKIDPDSFFGKHAAIIGSTGAGKSCTVATIIQSVLQHPQVKQTRFIILDTNGEYRSAFQVEENGKWRDAHPRYRCHYIPTDPLAHGERLVIPYWFMNSDDFVRLFQASPGVQRPVLLEALRAARMAAVGNNWIIDQFLWELRKISAWAERGEGTDARSIDQACKGALGALDRDEVRDALSGGEAYGVTQSGLREVFESIGAIVQEGMSATTRGDFYAIIDINKRLRIQRQIEGFLSGIDRHGAIATNSEHPALCVDNPSYFSKVSLRNTHLERALSRGDSLRAREHCATMLLRIDRLLEDKRFDFLLGPIGRDWPKAAHPLATFLRDILGMTPGDAPLSRNDEVSEGLLPFYDRQRARTLSDPYNIVIIDLSLLTAEVLENVTALIARLVLEFLQRAGETDVSGIERGSFPVVLVLDEAQNYVREPRAADDESISRSVFERIAREGRKYGLGLVVATQRPSELSRTLLSQCSSFVVHRLQNPEDLRYFERIVPGIYRQLLGQLPALAPQHALLLGECVPAPALIRIRNANPVPRSLNPHFYDSWTADRPCMPAVEAVCQKWETGGIPDNADL